MVASDGTVASVDGVADDAAWSASPAEPSAAAVVVGVGTASPVNAISVTLVGFAAATYPGAAGSVTSLPSPPVMRNAAFHPA